ncbi:MAG: dockerin type I repeat-containing protein [Planctomycetota bacterium]
MKPASVFPAATLGVLALVIGGLAAPTQNAWAANGDILASIAHCQTSGAVVGAVDLAYDNSTNNLFALDEGTGQICRYLISAFPPIFTGLTSIPNPFGGAGFPIPTNSSVGLAYNPTGNGGAGSIFVLNANNMLGIRIREANKTTGVQIGGDITVQVPMANSSPAGLTYDPTAGGSLWYRDTANNLLVNISLTGTIIGTVAIPGVDPNDVVRGRGLHYHEVAGQRFIEFTFGDVVDFQVQRTLRVNLTTGQLAPQQVKLDALYGLGDANPQSNPITGLVLPAAGSVYYVCTEQTIYRIDAVQPAVFPPTQLICRSRLDGAIELSWVNNGPGSPVGMNTNYAGGIQITRGTGNMGDPLIVSLPGSATSYIDTAITNPANPELLDTVLSYTVTGLYTGGTASAVCSVRTGRGALLSTHPFDGVVPYDLTYNPNTDEIFVTDNTTYGTGSPGRIYVYDTNLVLLRTIGLTIGGLQGICYDTDQNRLIVSGGSAAAQQTLRVIDPVSGAELNSYPVTVPTEPAPQIGSITYDTVARDYLFLNLTTSDLVRVEAEDNGMPLVPPTPGAFGGKCSAPFTDYSRAVTFLESGAAGSVLATIQGANQISQYNVTNCLEVSGGVGVPLLAIGGSLAQGNAVNGALDFGNTLYVAGGTASTIFRLLLAPAVDFKRGDANDDDSIDVADVLFVANFLFSAGMVPGCLDAADANDDGRVDISDPTYLLFHLFVPGSPTPPEPFPQDGTDLTFLDGLGC